MQDYLDITIKGQYKSIVDLEWSHIPPLAILTGPNGSGKTHILEAIYHGLSGTSWSGKTKEDSLEAEALGEELEPTDVVLISDPSASRDPTGVQLEQLRKEADQLRRLAQRPREPHDQWRRSLLDRLLPEESGSDNVETLIEAIKQNPSLILQRADPLEGISATFFGYLVKRLELKGEDVSEEEIRIRLGPPPWEILNEILEEAEFPYRCRAPVNNLFAAYHFRLYDRNSGIEIRPTDLSSGERVILSVLMWVYKSGYEGMLPKLLLLDEPDAHLHPSLTRTLLDVLINVLVRKHQVRIIMTTHSPSTVVLAPYGSLFNVTRINPRVTSCNDRSLAVTSLTSGLVMATGNSQYVFVESSADQDFYQEVVKLLEDPRVCGAEEAVPRTPSLVFVPTCRGRSGRGGKEDVRHLVREFSQPWAWGVIDSDDDIKDGRLTQVEPRVFRIARYEMENYLADPIVIFSYLVGRDRAQEYFYKPLRIGDEGHIRRLSCSDLQVIVNNVAGALREAIREEDRFEVTEDCVSVTYFGGKQLDIPRSIVEDKGKRFLGLIKRVFGASIDWSDLKIAFVRLRMPPEDLRDLVDRIKRSAVSPIEESNSG